MVAFTGDYYCMTPAWGVIEIEAEDKDDFIYSAELDVANMHEGARDIEIRNVKEVV